MLHFVVIGFRMPPLWRLGGLAIRAEVECFLLPIGTCCRRLPLALLFLPRFFLGLKHGITQLYNLLLRLLVCLPTGKVSHHHAATSNTVLGQERLEEATKLNQPLTQELLIDRSAKESTPREWRQVGQIFMAVFG